jgi:hypothetical protein
LKTAWADPATEAAVKELWEEVFSGVYRARFFNVERLAALREYLDGVADADIPLCPPHMGSC